MIRWSIRLCRNTFPSRFAHVFFFSHVCRSTGNWKFVERTGGGDRRGNSTEPPLSIFHSLTPPAGAGSSWRDFVFDRCAVASCVTTSICISNLRGWLSLSLPLHLPSPRLISLPPPSLFCLHLAIGFVARFLLKPLRIVFKSVRGSPLSSSVHPALSLCCCRYVAPSRSLIKLHPSIPVKYCVFDPPTNPSTPLAASCRHGCRFV